MWCLGRRLLLLWRVVRLLGHLRRRLRRLHPLRLVRQARSLNLHRPRQRKSASRRKRLLLRQPPRRRRHLLPSTRYAVKSRAVDQVIFLVVSAISCGECHSRASINAGRLSSCETSFHSSGPLMTFSRLSTAPSHASSVFLIQHFKNDVERRTLNYSLSMHRLQHTQATPTFFLYHDALSYDPI